MNPARIRARLACLLLTAAVTVVSLGCANATQGAVSGAGVGALSGLAIGSLSGDAGKGAAIGAVVGGVGGAVIGDQNRRQDEQAAAASRTPPPEQPPAVIVTGQPNTYSTGQTLGRLVGQWRVTGTIGSTPDTALQVQGSARGLVERTYFVRLDITFTDPRTGQPVEGTSFVSQTGGRGIEMSNAFSSSPVLKHFRGDVDATGTVLNLTQFSPAVPSRHVVIRLSSTTQWTADVWDGGNRVESYAFTWIGP